MNQTAPGGGLQLILLAGFLIPAIFFVISQQNTLKMVKRANRQMQPGLVWLQLIPFLGQIWQFVVIVKIAGSIRNGLAAEYEGTIFGADAAVAEKNAARWPTLGIGLAYCIPEALITLNNLFAAEGSGGNLELVGFLGLGMFVCWIIYWVQLAGYKNKLKQVYALG